MDVLTLNGCLFMDFSQKMADFCPTGAASTVIIFQDFVAMTSLPL